MAIKTTKPASIQVARNTPKTEPAPSARGLLWFDEQGHLNQSGAVTLDGYVGELLAQLRRFLSRLDALERTAGGDYRLRDSRLGNMSGTRVLWDNVALLARAALFKTLPAMTAAQHSEMKSTGVCVTTTGPMRNDRPLTDALRQLLFAPLYNDDGTWVSEIPAATVAKIRTIVDELTPAVAVPPDGSRYRPATWFGKTMAARLRMAARKKRKGKRVATIIIDGVVCYSVEDARRWWANDVPKEL